MQGDNQYFPPFFTVSKLSSKTTGRIPLRHEYNYSLTKLWENRKKNKEKSHARDTLQEKAQLEKYLLETAKILWKYTEPEKLNDFENNEKLSRLN